MFFKGSKRRLRMTVFISYKRNKWSQTTFLLISWKFSSGETPFCNYLPLPMPQSQTKSKRKKKNRTGTFESQVQLAKDALTFQFCLDWKAKQSSSGLRGRVSSVGSAGAGMCRRPVHWAGAGSCSARERTGLLACLNNLISIYDL